MSTFMTKGGFKPSKEYLTNFRNQNFICEINKEYILQEYLQVGSKV